MTASLIFCWLFAKIMTSLLEVVRCVQKGSIKMQPWKWTKDMATTYSHLSKDLITDLGQSIKANANGTGLQTGFCQWHPIHKFQSVSLCLESVENARYNFFYWFPVSHMLCGGDVFLSLRKHFQSGFTGQMIPPHVRHCRARFFYSTSVLFVVKQLDGKSCWWA